MQKKVSIVVPFYKHKKWLDEALESIVNQTYKNYSVVLVNDGSSENIDDILEKYKSIISNYIKQENKGAAAARNNAIENCDGDYIAFLDSDDIWTKEKLEKQIKYMEDNDYNWSTTWYKKFGINTNAKKEFGKEKEGYIFPYPVLSSSIGTPCVMIKSSILSDDYYRFDETIGAGEDSILWYKISKKYEIGVVKESLCFVRDHGNNASRDRDIQIKFKKEILSRINRGTLERFDAYSNLLIELGFMFVNFKCLFISKIVFKISKILNVK